MSTQEPFIQFINAICSNDLAFAKTKLKELQFLQQQKGTTIYFPNHTPVPAMFINNTLNLINEVDKTNELFNSYVIYV